MVNRSKKSGLKFQRVILTLLFCLFCAQTAAFAQNQAVIASAAASSYLDGNTPAKAIDNNPATYWKGFWFWIFGPKSWYLNLDLGKAHTLEQISILWNKDCGAANYAIQGSADNKTFVNLVTGQSSAGSKLNPSKKDHALTGSYRYIRINIARAQSRGPMIYDVKVFGIPAAAIDVAAPTGTIKINNDAASTVSGDVNLTLSAADSGSGLSEMKFSNDNLTWSDAQAYAVAKAWVLKPGTGTRTVYVKYKDKAGNWSAAFFDSINLLNQAPKAVSIEPAAGTCLIGDAVAFKTTFTDGNGAQDIKLAHLLVNTAIDGKNCFYGYYDRKDNKIYLRNDDDTKWLGGFAPGEASVIENSYAKLDCAKTTVTQDKDTMVITWAVTFKAAFSGSKKLCIYVKDESNAAGGWLKLGPWVIQGESDQFVKASGNKLILKGSQKPYFFSLANQYYLFYKPAALVDEVFADAKALGVTVIRTWGFCDGPYNDGVAGGPELAFQPQPGVYNEAAFKKMDYIIKKAKESGIRLVIPLVNNWSAFGGMDKYAEWSASAAKHDEFYTDAYCKKVYKDYAAYFLNRKNTLTNVVYKDDPTILVWELANEPRCASDLSGATLANWVNEMAGYIKGLDQNHLVATGEEGWYKFHGSDYLLNNGSPNIDICTFHLLSDDMVLFGAGALNWIRQHIDDAHAGLNKPVYCGEIGVKADRAAADFALQMHKRNLSYASWYNEFLNRGIDGAGFWLLSADAFADYDNYTVYVPLDAATNTIIKNFSDRMLQKGNAPLPPELLIEDTQTLEGQALEFRIGANNPSGFALSFSGVNLPATAAIDGNGKFSWPAPEAGVYTIGVNLSYDTSVISGSLVINVIDVDLNNTPKIADIPDIATWKNTPLDNAADLQAVTTDDGPARDIVFNVTCTEPNAGVTLDGNRYIDINPAKDYFGTALITITATDAVGLVGKRTINLRIREEAAIKVPADYSTIGQALSHAASGDAVLVAAGIFHETLVIPAGVTLLSVDGAAQTIIDASGYDYAVQGENSSAVDGFTLKNANIAGVLNVGNVLNNIIENNKQYGIILSGTGRAQTIVRNIIRNNDGPGIHSWTLGNTVKIVNNIIDNNKAQGISIYGGKAFLIANNIIKNNRYTSYGGGIRITTTDVNSKIVNNLVIDNATTEGAGIYLSDKAQLSVLNNIVITNAASKFAGGIRVWDSDPVLSYNDVWHNTPDNYTDASPVNSISLDPKFVNLAGGDYHLAAGSPCINAGYPDTQYNDKDGSRNDMGIYGGPSPF